MIRPRVLCLVGWLAGCASSPPPPAVLSLTMEAGADQNPDADGRATPVAIHIYQLAATSRFERAEVFALLERERDALGDDLLASQTLVLSPGEKRSVTAPLKPGIQSIGVAVAFRDIDLATWRVTAPVAASGKSTLELHTGGIIAQLAPAKPS